MCSALDPGRICHVTCTHCGHVNGGGLGLAEAYPSLLVQEGGVHVTESPEDFARGSADRNTGRVWEERGALSTECGSLHSNM